MLITQIKPLVMIIRHAEKPLTPDVPHGVTIEGEVDRDSLTPRGWQRAGALVNLFTAGHSGALSTPAHLFASQVVPGSGSRRSFETLQPLAERLGLPIDLRFPKEDLAGLAGAVRATAGVVLISWEHHLIPSLANMLIGDTSTAPQVWPDDRFDIIWAIEPGIGARVGSFRQVPELLLAGDRSDAIAT
jgi:broad specificity phosphatase PhoE